jgi:hypothetical protein
MLPLATVNSLRRYDITRMQHPVYDEELFMEESLAAIRQAITNDAVGEPTLAPARATDLPRTSGRETNTRGWIAVAPSDCRSRLCFQHLDGNCTEARADAGGCGSRNASPHVEVMAGRKLAPRGGADGAGRSRTDYSRTLTTILAELGPAYCSTMCVPPSLPV